METRRRSVSLNQRLRACRSSPRSVRITSLFTKAVGAFGSGQYRFLAIDPLDALSAIGIGIATTETFTFDEVGRTRYAGCLIDQWKRAHEAARESENGYVLVLD